MCNVFRFHWRTVYGVQKAYPANAPAEALASLMGVKTWSQSQVGDISGLASQLGFKIECVPDPRTPALQLVRA
jgi:hypothetical protein